MTSNIKVAEIRETIKVSISPNKLLAGDLLNIFIVGFITAIVTTLVYITSAIHTIMRFRSGVIPTLRNPDFIKYRSKLQDLPYLIWAMFSGLLASITYMISLVAGVVFLLTRDCE